MLKANTAPNSMYKYFNFIINRHTSSLEGYTVISYNYYLLTHNSISPLPIQACEVYNNNFIII